MSEYIIISPAHNEEASIERTILSVVKQTVLPKEWIIINDGSTDNTAYIVQSYVDKYPWIKLYSFEKSDVVFGEHVYANFYKGYSKITDDSWEFVVKLDTDLDIDREDFFEYQLRKMKDNEKLGICSGLTYSIQNGQKVLTKGRPYWRTGGAMKLYRRTCLEQIGGIKPIYGWDGLDEYEAMYYGWYTRTFFDLHVNHLGKARALNREKALFLARAKGKSLCQRGFPIEFVLLKGLSYIRKSVKHTFAFYKGYFNTKEAVVTKDQKRFFRKIQYLRLKEKLTNKKQL